MKNVVQAIQALALKNMKLYATQATKIQSQGLADHYGSSTVDTPGTQLLSQKSRLLIQIAIRVQLTGNHI